MKNLEQRGHLLTEQVNPSTDNLDLLTSLELVDLFNREDAQTLKAIGEARSVRLGHGASPSEDTLRTRHRFVPGCHDA